jgi:hypothetical protein
MWDRIFMWDKNTYVRKNTYGKTKHSYGDSRPQLSSRAKLDRPFSIPEAGCLLKRRL